MPSFSPAHHPPAGGAREIYVHCATSVHYLAGLNASIPAVERYAERALLLAERQDVVCLTDEIDGDYLEYLAEIGLGPERDNIVVASRFGKAERCRPLWQRLVESREALEHLGNLLRGRGSARIHPFIASSGQFQLAAALERRAGIPVRVVGGKPDLVASADHKHCIRARAIQMGIPVAPGEVVDLDRAESLGGESELIRSAIERQMGRTGQVIVRGTSGAAGSATFVARRGEVGPLSRRLALERENRIYLVESMMEARVSPNVQMYIDPVSGSIECVGLTDQRWEQGLVHGGNIYPSTACRIADMVRWSYHLSDWLREAGYAGILGLDFVEYTGSQGEAEAFLAEVNPRVNSATYPLRVIQRLNRLQRRSRRPQAGAFLTGTARTEARSFGQLRDLLKDLLFSPESGTGLVPYVTGRLAYGKCGLIALAGTRQESAELYDEAQMAMEHACLTN